MSSSSVRIVPASQQSNGVRMHHTIRCCGAASLAGRSKHKRATVMWQATHCANNTGRHQYHHQVEQHSFVMLITSRAPLCALANSTTFRRCDGFIPQQVRGSLLQCCTCIYCVVVVYYLNTHTSHVESQCCSK